MCAVCRVKSSISHVTRPQSHAFVLVWLEMSADRGGAVWWWGTEGDGDMGGLSCSFSILSFAAHSWVFVGVSRCEVNGHHNLRLRGSV